MTKSDKRESRQVTSFFPFDVLFTDIMGSVYIYLHLHGKCICIL